MDCLQLSTDTSGRVRTSAPACAWGGALGASGAEKSGRNLFRGLRPLGSRETTPPPPHRQAGPQGGAG